MPASFSPAPQLTAIGSGGSPPATAIASAAAASLSRPPLPRRSCCCGLIRNLLRCRLARSIMSFPALRASSPTPTVLPKVTARSAVSLSLATRCLFSESMRQEMRPSAISAATSSSSARSSVLNAAAIRFRSTFTYAEVYWISARLRILSSSGFRCEDRWMSYTSSDDRRDSVLRHEG